MANHFVQQRQWEAAVITLIIYHCYLRPGEPFRLIVGSVVPPVPDTGPIHARWSLTTHQHELGISSKTQEFDESLQIDQQQFPFLGPALMTIANGRAQHLPLFPLQQSEYNRLFRQAVVDLPLAALGQVAPYQLRHAGASNDFSSGRRTLIEIQRRGRWRSTASVRRYEEGGRVTEQLRRLPERLRIHGVTCGLHIASIVSGMLSPLRPP